MGMKCIADVDSHILYIDNYWVLSLLFLRNNNRWIINLVITVRHQFVEVYKDIQYFTYFLTLLNKTIILQQKKR